MGAPTAQAASQDPVRATLVEILRQLNQADAKHEGAKIEQALELSEIQDRLHDFWGVTKGQVKIQLAVGLLLRNGLVAVQAPGEYPGSASGRPATAMRSRPRARSSSWARSHRPIGSAEAGTPRSPRTRLANR